MTLLLEGSQILPWNQMVDPNNEKQSVRNRKGVIETWWGQFGEMITPLYNYKLYIEIEGEQFPTFCIKARHKWLLVSFGR